MPRKKRFPAMRAASVKKLYALWLLREAERERGEAGRTKDGSPK
jgi:hypothetical protein